MTSDTNYKRAFEGRCLFVISQLPLLADSDCSEEVMSVPTGKRWSSKGAETPWKDCPAGKLDKKSQLHTRNSNIKVFLNHRCLNCAQCKN